VNTTISDKQLKENIQWRKDSDHLPECLKDFHDAKAVFRTIGNYLKSEEGCPVSWVNGHVYTIDWFLWFMAVHGYKLTKTTAKVKVKDLNETIKDFDPRNTLTKAVQSEN
jgi:hypothetical protein